MTNLKNRSIAASFAMLATVVTVVAATPVRAETVRESVAIRFNSHDVATPEGLARLDRRVRVAADDVCGAGLGGDRFRIAACRNKAITDGRAQIAAAIVRHQTVQVAAR